jgi:hypothetical protein
MLILIVVVSCQLENDSRLNSVQNSESVIDSKNKKVFIAEYDFFPKSITVSGRLYIIKEVWEEIEWMYIDPKEHRSWIYQETKTEDLIIERMENSQIVFIFNEKILGNKLGVSKDSLQNLDWCNACGYNANDLIIRNEEKELLKDTLVLYLFEDNYWGSGNKPNRFITEMKLIKK